MTLYEHAQALRARYNDQDLHRIQQQAERTGHKNLNQAAALATLIISKPA